MASALKRLPTREESCQVPRPLGHGRFEVDGTWGEVEPLELGPGVRTVGELEVIDHLRRGLPIVDTRLEHFHREATIPGARWICHEQILDHLDELNPGQPTVFFCNGPQCTATPDAVAQLLRSGFPGTAILYYRGGIHDWMTLGYPVVPGADAPAANA